jgi:tetratricopeptide (TPR) repeat protein
VALSEDFAAAESHRIDGRYDEAVELYKKVLEEDPQHFGATVGLGLVYGFTGLFDESIELLQKCVELDPSSLGARMYLAKTHLMLGMYEEASEGFTEILKTDPENEEALKQKAFLKEFGIE